MRKGLKRFGGALRRVATVGVTAALALGMAVTGPVSAIAAEVAGGTDKTDDGVTLTKTATWDDEVADQANVELSIGSTEDVVESNVVFVIDKSTSFDVRDEANKMLAELLKRASDGTIINVAVVSFENSADVIQNWTVLSESTIGGIQSAIENKMNESGTNIQKGLAKAHELLNGVSGYKYLVLLTDGITYQWGDGQTIYTEQASNGEESLNAGNDMNGAHHSDLAAYYAEFSNVAQWMANHGDAIAQDIQKYGRTYTSGQIQPNNGKGHQTESTYDGFDETKNDYVKYEDASTHYSANDAAVYQTVVEWQNLAKDGVTLFAYADSTGDPNTKGSNAYNSINNPWAASYISSLDTIAGTSGMVDNNAVDGMFDGVMNTVLYEIESGTVTDVIGNDFDLVGLDTIKMSVGSTELKGTVDEAAGTVTFGDKDEYVVSYTKAEDGTETLTWKIGAPVESANGITLSYALNLVNKSTVPGTYPVVTNEEAKLTYESTDGGDGEGTFPVPELSYTVDEPSAVTTGGFVAKKELVDTNGNELDLKDGQFKFQVKDAEGNVIDEATNDAEGDIQFKKDMTFDAAGDYTYTISEVNDGQDGITYDTDDVTVTVHVADTDNDGDLDATWSYADDDMTFTNVSTAKEAAPSTITNSNLPKTSDPMSLVGVGTALVGGLGAGATGLVMRRRNR